MIITEKPEFRKLDLPGLKILTDWARTEGWNPGPHDADAFMATDPEGFYGFFLGNSLIAGGAVISYNGEFGFMGLFIVKPEYRNQGIGKELWYRRRDLLINRLKENSPIGMDGVVAMQPFYQKGGFEIAYTAKRFEKQGFKTETSPQIKAIGTPDFDRILAYDTLHFGFRRESFLKSWIALPGNKTFVYKNEDGICGYAIVRKAASGYKIGPLFADTPFIAEELYKACLNSVPGELLYMDVPVINDDAVAIIKKYEAKYVFECARMYYGRPPQINAGNIYGVTTFELG